MAITSWVGPPHVKTDLYSLLVAGHEQKGKIDREVIGGCCSWPIVGSRWILIWEGALHRSQIAPNDDIEWASLKLIPTNLASTESPTQETST